MSLQCRKQDGRIYISGDTYLHREAFKAIGGRFCWESKSWVFADTLTEWDKVRRLCAELDQSARDFQEDEASQAARSQKIIESVTMRASQLPSTRHADHTDQALVKLNCGDGNHLSAPESSASSAASMFASALTQNHQFIGDDEELIPVESSSSLSNQPAKVYSIRELAGIVEAKITKSFVAPIWIVGEIKDFSVAKGGHRYFKLAESVRSSSREYGQAGAVVNACLWRERYYEFQRKFSAQLLADLLKDDIKIKMYARVTYYRKKGQLSLEVIDLDPEFTAGELALARQKLLKELERKGLRDRQKRVLKLPLFPFRVGLITAAGSRAYSDFIHQLNEKPYGVEVVFFPASMQGERCSQEVSYALQCLHAQQMDLIVLTRGGGSMVDLQWFNDAEIAYTIAGLNTPVIAAIGHHDDECVAQDVAHTALKTPTATAEYICLLFQQVHTRLEEMSRRCLLLLETSYEVELQKFQSLEQRFKLQVSATIYAWEAKLGRLSQQLFSSYHEYEYRQTMALKEFELNLQQCSYRLWNHTTHQLTALTHRFFDVAKDKVATCHHQLNQLDKQFHTVNPLPWLEAGWAMVVKDSLRVRSVIELDEGDEIDLRLKGGHVFATVKQVKPIATLAKRDS